MKIKSICDIVVLIPSHQNHILLHLFHFTFYNIVLCDIFDDGK